MGMSQNDEIIKKNVKRISYSFSDKGFISRFGVGAKRFFSSKIFN